MFPVEAPFKTYTGLDGKPLDAGRVYFGVVDQNPVTAPVTVYWDAAGTQPAVQPLRTVNGYIVRAGAPANVFVEGAYSELVTDSKERQVFYARDSDDFSIASFVERFSGPYGSSILGHLDPATDAVATLMSEIASRTISVFDFMSTAERADFLSGAPVLDHAPAVNRAIAATNGKGRVMAHRKRTGEWLFKTPIAIGASNLVDSNVVLDFEPGSRQQFDPADIADTMFSVKNFPGHFNLQGVNNLHAYSLSAKGTAFKFNGQCYGSFDDNYLETFNAGIIFSNAGNQVFNEFVRFNNLELHLCTTGILMDKDGGTDTSMHGLTFRNTTINVGPGQVGLQMIGAAWYNADSDLKFFSAADSEAIIKMQTGLVTQFEGAFISGSITCEGPAKITGIGRFILNGQATFLSGATDTLVAPDAWEQGFTAHNYLKPVLFGSSGLTVGEVRDKADPIGTDGPFGSFARLYGASVESIVANAYLAHTAAPGNGFYTATIGYRQNFDDALLGHFLSSDGTEQRSFAPTSVQCVFKHNEQFIFRFDGINRANNTEGFLIGSGGAGVYAGNMSPEGVLSASVSSTFQRRDGGAVTAFYVKESGSGNTGWVAK